MKSSRLTQSIIAAGLALAAMAAPVRAMQLDRPAAAELVRMAEADCYSVGEQIAAEQGGTLARATQRNRGGQTVCVIVVLVPGRDGQRPRRAEFVVPAN